MVSVKSSSPKVKSMNSSFIKDMNIFDIFYHFPQFEHNKSEVWKGKNLCPEEKSLSGGKISGELSSLCARSLTIIPPEGVFLLPIHDFPRFWPFNFTLLDGFIDGPPTFTLVNHKLRFKYAYIEYLKYFIFRNRWLFDFWRESVTKDQDFCHQTTRLWPTTRPSLIHRHDSIFHINVFLVSIFLKIMEGPTNVSIWSFHISWSVGLWRKTVNRKQVNRIWELKLFVEQMVSTVNCQTSIFRNN